MSALGTLVRSRGQGEHNRTTTGVPGVRREADRPQGRRPVAPATRGELEAALDAGVDVIEFDVLLLRDGRLVLPTTTRTPASATADAGGGLDLFAGEAYTDSS